MTGTVVAIAAIGTLAVLNTLALIELRRQIKLVMMSRTIFFHDLTNEVEKLVRKFDEL